MHGAHGVDVGVDRRAVVAWRQRDRDAVVARSARRDDGAEARVGEVGLDRVELPRGVVAERGAAVGLGCEVVQRAALATSEREVLACRRVLLDVGHGAIDDGWAPAPPRRDGRAEDEALVLERREVIARRVDVEAHGGGDRLDVAPRRALHLAEDQQAAEHRQSSIVSAASRHA